MPLQHHNSNNAVRARRGARATSYSRFKPTIPDLRASPELANTASEQEEAARSFELPDDGLFCPFHLLTEEDLQSMRASNYSDRSSLSSNSPDASPLPMQPQPIQPNPSYMLPTAANFNNYRSPMNKLYQPSAQRFRAIPIVDPRTTTPPATTTPNPPPQPFARRW